MPRRRYPQRREVIPDPIYNSQLVTRFINSILRDGKRTVAEGVFYGALEIIKTRTQDDPVKVNPQVAEA